MATVTSLKRHLVLTSDTYTSNGDVVVGGDLTIQGTTTTLDTANLLVEDKNIIIGNVSSPSDTTADGGGITLKGASDKTISWSNANNRWDFNQGITSSGDITAANLSGTNTGNNAANTHSSLFIDRGSIDVTTASGGSNSNPFDDAHTETKVAENGMRTLNYTGASAFMYTFNNGGSASVVQIGAHYNGDDYYLRTRTDSSNWKTWKKIRTFGNTTIPTVPDSYAPTDAEANVQANWTEATTTSDAFILNKPSTFPPSSHNHDGRYPKADVSTAADSWDSTEFSQYSFSGWDANGADWTPSTGWYWGLTLPHVSNTSSYNYSGQIVISNDSNANMYVRTISNSTENSWKQVYHEGHKPTFAEIATTPTTLAGYGITDAAPSTVVNQTDFVSKANGGTFAGNIAVQDISMGSTNKFTHGSYLELSYGAGNTSQFTFNADYDGAQTGTYTPHYSGTTSSGMSIVKMPSGGVGGLDFYVKQHGTTSGSHNISTFTKILELNQNGTSTFGGNIVMAANATVDGVDISGLPTSFAPINAEQNVQSDWNATSGDALILNKPTIPPDYGAHNGVYLKTNYRANWIRVGYGDSGGVRYHKLATIVVPSSYVDYNATFDWTGRYASGTAGIHVNSGGNTTAVVYGAWYEDFNPTKTLENTNGWIKYTISGDTVEIWIKTSGWREFDYVRKDSVTEGSPTVTWYDENTTTDQSTEPSNLNAFTNRTHTAAGYSTATGVADNAEVNVQADWTATSGDALILNKPTTFAPSAHNQAWSTITSTPTTLSGYGITDIKPAYINHGVQGDHDMHTWDKVHAVYSDASGSNTYWIITTNVPQDNYSMGGFELIFEDDYSGDKEGGTIKIYGYWNPESNGGFTGFKYTTDNPNLSSGLTIQVGRNSSGKTCFAISGHNQNYAQIIAKNLWLGYNASSANSTWGDSWSIATSASTGLTNLNTLTKVPDARWDNIQGLPSTFSPPSTYQTSATSDDKYLRYKGIASAGDWDTIFTTGTGNTNTSGLFQINNHAATGNSNTPTGSYTFGSVLAWQLANATFKLYAPHTGNLHYQTGWNNDEYSGWRKIWDSGNDGASSGLDADKVDGLHAGSFIRSDAADTATQKISFTASESIGLKGARGAFTGEYIHLYNKVGIGHPSGWGQGNTETPSQGLSTYGGMNISYGTKAESTICGNLNIGTAADTGNRDLFLHGSTANKKSRLRTTNGNLHIDSAEGNSLYLNYYYGASTNIYFGTGNGGYCGTVSSAGVLRMAGDVVAYYSFSDRRLKTNIKKTENNLDKILSLNPVEYTWKEGPREGVKEIGLIAQEVEEVVPEVVRLQSRHHDEKTEGEEYKQVDYEHLVSTLIGAMQEQQKQIDELKSQMAMYNAKSCKCKK